MHKYLDWEIIEILAQIHLQLKTSWRGVQAGFQESIYLEKDLIPVY